MSNSILSAYTTKKGKKEFEKLPAESKAKVIQAAIDEKLAPVMAKEIAKGVMTGMDLEREHIYNNYVSKIDEYEINSLEWFKQVDVLLSYLRVKHLNYLAKQVDAENESEDE